MSERMSAASRRNMKVAASCTAFVIFMTGMAFAAVPLYDLFCRVTGYGGTTQRAEAESDRVLDRTIVVRFDANVAGGLPWDFRPEARTVELRIGETGMINYTSLNLSARETVGTSTFNVSPPSAGQYFNKIECFCFTEQPLESGESVEMPVTFFIDPAIVDDPNAAELRVITLSYTFYPVREPSGPVASARDDAQDSPL